MKVPSYKKQIISLVVLSILIIGVYTSAYIVYLNNQQKELEADYKATAESYVTNLTIDLRLKAKLDDSTILTFNTTVVDTTYSEESTPPDAVDLEVTDGRVSSGTLTYGKYLITITNNQAVAISEANND